ncbi:MAG TPA: hypothetical protein VLF41_02235 [Candidatus Nanoarchaeia archaeon]|nr:hypothetical protein [Candidatus Nanoarchaeia archaeon]
MARVRRQATSRHDLIVFAYKRRYECPTYVGGRAFYLLLEILATKGLRPVCEICGRQLEFGDRRTKAPICCQGNRIPAAMLRQLHSSDLPRWRGRQELRLMVLLRQYFGYK